jgi:cytochrome c biogenesis protein CcmG/thiol:disulfide interchange protein DsbE
MKPGKEIAPALIVLGLGAPLCFLFAQSVTGAESARRQAPLRAVLGDSAYEALRRGDKSGLHYMGNSRQAPDFTLDDRQGRPWRLREHRGRLVVMNFWSVDCPPCLRELPGLARLSREARRRGDMEVVTVSTDQDWSRVRPVLAPYPGLKVLFDPEKKVVRDMYGTLRYPETWIVDARGVIRLRVDGPRNWSDPLSLDVLELFL